MDQRGTWERSVGSEERGAWAGLFLVGPPCLLWVGEHAVGPGQPRPAGIVSGGGRGRWPCWDLWVQPGCCPGPRHWAPWCHRKKAAHQEGTLGSRSGSARLWPEMLLEWTGQGGALRTSQPGAILQQQLRPARVLCARPDQEPQSLRCQQERGGHSPHLGKERLLSRPPRWPGRWGGWAALPQTCCGHRGALRPPSLVGPREGDERPVPSVTSAKGALRPPNLPAAASRDPAGRVGTE